MTFLDQLQQLFDNSWYLHRYPDVAKATTDGWSHFIEYGRYEGRWPISLAAIEADQALWQQYEDAIVKLRQLVNSPQNSLVTMLESELASWFLARWYASQAQWDEVLDLLKPLETGGLVGMRQLIPHAGPFLCLFQALLERAQPLRAKELLNNKEWPLQTPRARNDHVLAASMLYTGAERLNTINTIYQQQGLALMSCNSQVAQQTPALDDLTAASVKPITRKFWQTYPKVSVIVPCYNCEQTVATAVASLIQQSWKRLELILVNDASTDGTANVLAQLASDDKRIKVVTLSCNEGAYGARNAGLDACSGDFITTHDADDWSHPDKIAIQVEQLIACPKVVANRTAWVRADESLNFSRWRPEASWIYPNVSSLMMRKRVVKTVGYWDTVSVDGDTEFYNRLVAQFGAAAVQDVKPEIPLALGRIAKSSLTQSSATHIRSMVFGVRASYQAAASSWHESSKRLYLDRYANQRCFKAPLSICRGTQSAQEHNQLLQLKASELFDADYYLARYPDVNNAGIDAAKHYLKFGGAEGRDPSERFSSSGYRYCMSLAADVNPLLHFLQQCEQLPTLTMDKVMGAMEPPVTDKPVILIVAHSTTGHTFGAERSLLDVLAMLADDFYLWVVLPGAMNTEYVDELKQKSDRLNVLPMRWWNDERTTDSAVMATLEQWSRWSNLVYVNTLTQHEPLVAADSSRTPLAVHVRELPEHDSDLCEALKATPAAIRRHILGYNPFIIANSEVVADYMSSANEVVIVPNVINLADYARAKSDTTQPPLKVGMLSSNLAKKGVDDFYRLAELMCADHRFEWHVFGPDTTDLEKAHKQYTQAKVVRHGYVNNPVEALKEIDVVLNLSHFQESFGRTALEGLAAGKLVIGYDWGAITELLSDGAGILVAFGDVAQLANELIRIAESPYLLTNYHERAYARASLYQFEQVQPLLCRRLKDFCQSSY